MIVSKIEPEQTELVFNLLRNMHTENAMFPLSEERMKRHVVNTSKTGTLLGLWDGPETIIGTLGLIFTRPWYSDEIIMTDRFFYIHNEHRTFKAFKVLMKAAIDIAMLNEVKLTIELNSPKETERKERLFERYMDRFSRFYCLEATTTGGAFLKEAEG